MEQRRALTALNSENRSIWADSQLIQLDWLIISQTLQILKTFKRYTEMFSSGTANLSLFIPMIHTTQEDLLPEPYKGHTDLVPAMCTIVRRLQDGLEVHFRPLKAGLHVPYNKSRITEWAKHFSHWRDKLSSTIAVHPPPSQLGDILPEFPSRMAVEMAVISWMFGPSGSRGPIRENMMAVMVRKYLFEL